MVVRGEETYEWGLKWENSYGVWKEIVLPFAMTVPTYLQLFKSVFTVLLTLLVWCSIFMAESGKYCLNCSKFKGSAVLCIIKQDTRFTTQMLMFYRPSLWFMWSITTWTHSCSHLNDMVSQYKNSVYDLVGNLILPVTEALVVST